MADSTSFVDVVTYQHMQLPAPPHNHHTQSSTQSVSQSVTALAGTADVRQLTMAAMLCCVCDRHTSVSRSAGRDEPVPVHIVHLEHGLDPLVHAASA